MKFFLLLLFSISAATVFAQDSWKVCFDKKTLLSTSVESEEKNVIKISSAQLKKYKSLVVTYKEKQPKKDWQRTITVYYQNDKEFTKQTGNTLKIKLDTAFTNLLQSSKTIKIYTVSLPTDPNLAAQVRVRRVHLCTLILE